MAMIFWPAGPGTKVDDPMSVTCWAGRPRDGGRPGQLRDFRDCHIGTVERTVLAEGEVVSC